MPNAGPLLELRGITKRFTGVVAVDHVDFDVNTREIHAIIGENGAGKSTLCKMITGAYSVDEGQILINGKEVHFSGPRDSRNAGIQMVYQERSLISYLDGSQNICLNSEPMKGLVVDEKTAMKTAVEIRKQLEVDVPLDVPVEELGAGEQQLVEIMRAFVNHPKLLILDEPTASLGEGEIEPFLKFVKRLAKEMDIAIIFITHKLEEIFTIADRVTVLTDGHESLTANIREITQDECIRAMIRSDKMKSFEVPVKDHNAIAANKVLEVEKTFYDGKSHNTAFYVCYGEVVGFYGLVGAGRTETMETIAGIRYADNQTVKIDGREIKVKDSFQMIREGIVLTPELRKNGVFPALDLVENVCALFIDRLASKRGWVNKKKSLEFAKEVLDENGTKYSDVGQHIGELSGGNMQKIIVGRSIRSDNLKLLIADEPTTGLDLGAKSEIYVKLRHLADDLNKSVVFISSELEELMKTCDRMYIFYGGDIVKELKRDEFDKQVILNYTLGGAGSENEIKQ